MTDIRMENRNLDECMEECHYSSRFCNEQEDGTFVCPTSWSECVDECKHSFSS